MLIVDSQIHVWKAETPDRPWTKGACDRMARAGHRLTPFLFEEALEEMGRAGVDRCCLIPPSWEGDRIDYSLEAAERHPGQFCVIALVPQNDGVEGPAVMRSYKSIPHVKGVRLTFNHDNDEKWLVDGTCDWIWPLAEELGMPLMIHAPRWKRDIGQIAKRHPGLKLIVDHMGMPSHIQDEAIAAPLADTGDLGAYPNVYVKLSAVPTYSSAHFPYANIKDTVKSLIQKMGVQRCFWGSDITRVSGRKGITYRQCVEHFTHDMGLGEDALGQVMGRALCDTLDWH